MSTSQTNKRLHSMKSNITCMDADEPSDERRSLIFNAYEGIQSAGDGSVELGHVRELAKLVNPEVSLDEAVLKQPWLDNTNTYGVSLHEFGEVMKIIGQDLEDDQLEEALQGALEGKGKLLAAVRKLTGQRSAKADASAPAGVKLQVNIPGESSKSETTTHKTATSSAGAELDSQPPTEEQSPIKSPELVPAFPVDKVDSPLPHGSPDITPQAAEEVAAATAAAARAVEGEEGAVVQDPAVGAGDVGEAGDECPRTQGSEETVVVEEGEAEAPAEAPEPVLEEELEVIEAPEPYLHPSGCRAYLQKEVVPTLREGLSELLNVVEENQFLMAAGKPWDVEEGEAFLPRGWMPFSPYRWLAEWILTRLPPLPLDPSNAGFIGGSREEQVAVVFDVMETTQAAPPSASYVFDFTMRMEAVSEQECAALLEEAHIDPEAEAVRVDQLMMMLVTAGRNFDDHEFELSLLRALSGSLGSISAMGIAVLPHCTDSRVSRFIFLYLLLLLANKQPSIQEVASASLNSQASAAVVVPDEGAVDGEQEAGAEVAVSAEQADRLLPLNAVQQLMHNISECKKQEALALVGKEVASQVTIGEFVAAMEHVFAGVSEEDGSLDLLVKNFIEKPSRNVAASLEAAVMEIEPEELQEKIQTFDTFSTVQHVGFSELEDIRSSTLPALLLLDVRSQGELDVSFIPGALHAPVTSDPSTERKWYLPKDEVEKVRSAISEAESSSGIPPIVVTYCTAGARSSAAAMQLSESLGLPVNNLCGGIISYYNQGGNVQTPEGKAVQSIHPGDATFADFVVRPNGFKFPAAE